MSCSHKSPQWNLAECNEDGWQCIDCGLKLGFRPDLDREHTREKVSAILFWLHESKFMYVSNSTMGDGMTADVARRCHVRDTFDQLSIVQWLIDASSDTHREFWRLEAKQAMCSHPSRTPDEIGGNLTCNACGHKRAINTSSGPLFDSQEPF